MMQDDGLEAVTTTDHVTAPETPTAKRKSDCPPALLASEAAVATRTRILRHLEVVILAYEHVTDNTGIRLVFVAASMKEVRITRCGHAFWQDENGCRPFSFDEILAQHEQTR